MNPGFVLGVDGGGSKTHLALASSDGRLRAMVAGPGSNLEWQKAGKITDFFSGLLHTACRQAGAKPREIRSSCFGLCGADIAGDFRYVEERIVGHLRLGGPVKVHNDAFIAMFNDGWRDRGAVVTVGSGHKWLALNGKREFMHDGLVFQGLRDMVMEELLKTAEGFIRPDRFTNGMLRGFGFSSPKDFLRRWRYGGSREYVRKISAGQWKRIAKVQKRLGEEASRGNQHALALLDRYAASLAGGTDVAVRRVGATGRGLEVVMSGSVLAGIPALRRAFQRHLKAILPGAVPVQAVFRPVRGALIHSAHMAWGGLPAGSLDEPSLSY